MTTTDTMEEVISDGIRFLESMTRHYGAEKGMALWDQMGEVMGADVKGKVFFAMLTGHSSTRVRITRGSCEQAVAAIKAIRTATGWGLKEAKDAWDLSAQRSVTLDLTSQDSVARRMVINDLRNLGLRVS